MFTILQKEEVHSSEMSSSQKDLKYTKHSV